ncbi:PII-type proteinase [Kordia sp. SMS9]|uniref:S8 family serine peptidase n=1 Tax=Kordia sp. SMS9 TaxID=2282170 RepID=UPI000E0D5C3D|nr:immunoglobulin-like domain-containing protein [Kordia sp. SMS9]AXG69098.1 PII-type proteinase [Kordia sp. SMS9]
MKNKYLSLGLLALGMFFTQTSFGQTDAEKQKIVSQYDLQALGTLENKLTTQQAQEKQRAIQLAQQNGWEIRTTLPDGTLVELQRVTADGQPVYYRTFNVDAARSTRTDHLNAGGSLGLNLMGQNMTAYVWDGGVARASHQEYDGAGGTNRFSTGDSGSLNYHSAHVTGTIMASGVVANAKGMAPHASAVGYDWNSDLGEATSAASSGMLVSNHSYGFRGDLVPDYYFGAYITESRDWDEIMFNAPNYLMVVAAGNDGNQNGYNASPLGGNSSYDKLTGHSTSKNNLVVANAQDANIDASGNLISVAINSSSSEGPTDDYRIKPDITGNGTGVYSTYQNSDTAYNSITGTSMASPNVAGSVLLLQQHYNNTNGSFARAATIKGLALHTADDAGASGPDAVFGWGLMNTKRAAEAISNDGNEAKIEQLTLTSGQTYSITVDSDGTNPLLASISWTDRAGTATTATNSSTAVLVNDLDIRVTKGGTTYNPWRLTGVTTNGTGDNTVDPYERVDVSGASGTYTITVTHKGSLVGGSQDFSLIVTGLSGTPVVCNATTPTGVSASGITTSGADIDWNTVTAATYDVRYRQSGTSTWTTNAVATNSTTLTGLAASTSYEVQVRSVCPSGNSLYSSSVTFTTADIPAFCSGSISSFPYSEGFEAGDGWTQVGGDDGDWYRTSGSTPSSGTGPTSAAQGTNYLFLEASTNSSPGQIGNNGTAILESDCFNLAGKSSATFSFQNHMYGTAVGSITVQASTDGTSWANLWSDSGDKGNQWNSISVNLSAYLGQEVKLRIVGTTGNGWSSDIAIDDLSVTAVDASADTTAPVITLNGAATINLTVGDSFTDPGATASDNIDGDLTSSIVVTGSVNTSVTGTYTLNYNVSDAAGNDATQVSRTVNVDPASTGGCSGGVSSFPYSEGFENTLGAWSQSTTDDINWSITSGGTPSSGTGPTAAAEGSYYIFVEASGSGTGYPNKQAILNSPCFDLSGETQATFAFSYSMYGAADMGSISLEASDDDGATWTSLWSETGNKGTGWQTASVNLASYVGGSVQLRFNRITGSTWQADIAIDGVSLSTSGGSGPSCSNVSLSITFDNYPEETSWEITNSGGTVVASGGTYASQADGSTLVIDAGCLDDGCYDFTITDAYGDGICCAYGNGSFTLTNNNTGATLASGGSFTTSDTTNFCVSASGTTATADYMTTFNDTNVRATLDVKIYPNPVKGATLNVTTLQDNASYTIMNMVGQHVAKGNIVSGAINVSKLRAGVYMIQINTGSQTVTKKFIKQ